MQCTQNICKHMFIHKLPKPPPVKQLEVVPAVQAVLVPTQTRSRKCGSCGGRGNKDCIDKVRKKCCLKAARTAVGGNGAVRGLCQYSDHAYHAGQQTIWTDNAVAAASGTLPAQAPRAGHLASSGSTIVATTPATSALDQPPIALTNVPSWNPASTSVREF